MNVDGLLRTASAHIDSGRHAAAIASAKQALSLAPESRSACNLLALALMQTGDLKGAEEAILAPGPPADVNTFALLTQIQFRQRRPEQATKTAREMIRCWPNNADAHFIFGGLLQATQVDRARYGLFGLATKRTHPCEGHWEEAIKLAPEHLPARAALGGRALKTKNLRRARLYADACLALDPSFAPGRLLAGKVAWRAGDWTAARDHAEWLLANNKVDQTALALLYQTKMPLGLAVRTVLRWSSWFNGRPLLICLSFFAACSLLGVLLAVLRVPLSPAPDKAMMAAIILAGYAVFWWPNWRASRALKQVKLPNSF